MTRKEITIQLDSGLETRPVALLVQVASQYDSDIYIEHHGNDGAWTCSGRECHYLRERY